MLPDTISKIKAIRSAQLAKRANGYVFIKTPKNLLKKNKQLRYIYLMPHIIYVNLINKYILLI